MPTKRLQSTKNNNNNASQQSSTLARQQPSQTQVGVHGLRLKRFEEVVAKLLASVEPTYVALPPPPPEFRSAPHPATGVADHMDRDGDDWLFSRLPPSARVVGNHPHPKRARNKEGQLRSMLRGILPLVPKGGNPPRPVTIVDFGGGSGHLGIPLALLLPHCKIIVVDFNARSIDLLHEKAHMVMAQVHAETDPQRRERYAGFASKLAKTPKMPSKLNLRCCGTNTSQEEGGILENLFTFCGPVEDFVGEALDVAIALHLCGEATDVCLRAAIREQAASLIVAPCCVGKLSGNAFNPDVFHATGQNEATVSYPQSRAFGRILSKDQPGYRLQQDWNALAKAADYSDETEFRTSRNASRRTAKALLETDRRLFLQDAQRAPHGRGIAYTTALAKMDPLEVTPKNDILVAWNPQAFEETTNTELNRLFGTPDTDCEADIAVAKAHLLHAPAAAASSNNETTSNANPERSTKPPQESQSQSTVDRNDWTREEEAEIKATILAFLETSSSSSSRTQTHPTPENAVLVFPTRMGGRKRKLIHFVAEALNLAHWGQGKKVSEKTVAVARSRPPRGKTANHETKTLPTNS